MAKLTKTDVLHVAKLAKLELTNKEIEKFTPQLSKVIDFISELNEVDTTGVEPTSQTTGLVNVFRDDEINTQRCLTPEAATSNSEEVYNNYFKVKAILEGRTDK